MMKGGGYEQDNIDYETENVYYNGYEGEEYGEEYDNGEYYGENEYGEDGYDQGYGAEDENYDNEYGEHHVEEDGGGYGLDPCEALLRGSVSFSQFREAVRNLEA